MKYQKAKEIIEKYYENLTIAPDDFIFLLRMADDQGDWGILDYGPGTIDFFICGISDESEDIYFREIHEIIDNLDDHERSLYIATLTRVIKLKMDCVNIENLDDETKKEYRTIINFISELGGGEEFLDFPE